MPNPGERDLTRISDILRSSIPKPGYTLLEILVVIAMIGLMAGIALPRLTSIHTSVQWASERDDVMRRIAGLGFSAFREGRDFELKRYPSEASEKIPLELPLGWTAEADPPIQYKANGVCLGGKLHLKYGERSIVVHMRAPKCRPEARGNGQ